MEDGDEVHTWLIGCWEHVFDRVAIIGENKILETVNFLEKNVEKNFPGFFFLHLDDKSLQIFSRILIIPVRELNSRPLEWQFSFWAACQDPAPTGQYFLWEGLEIFLQKPLNPWNSVEFEIINSNTPQDF